MDFMLRNSFIHIRGVGSKREKALHRLGFTSWDDFLSRPNQTGLPASVAEAAVRLLEESCYRLEQRDALFFHRCLPSSERWRIWRDFEKEAVFLDIETTGMGPPVDYVTVVGLHDSHSSRSFVRGDNLFMLPEELAKYRLVVTFNGSQFDLPFLKSHMGDIFAGHAHMDLRFVLRRLGYRGGLKSIERQLGISRPDAVAGMDGFEAVRLWHRHLAGDENSLDKLIEYNRQDIENLRPLMKLAYEKLKAMTFTLR
jgi:uncharacterized protein YprB with RNaseH-like and TPR domain